MEENNNNLEQTGGVMPQNNNAQPVENKAPENIVQQNSESQFVTNNTPVTEIPQNNEAQSIANNAQENTVQQSNNPQPMETNAQEIKNTQNNNDNNVAPNPGKKKNIGKIIAIIVVSLIVLSGVSVFALLLIQYNKGSKALDGKQYEDAITTLEKISWYSDSSEKLKDAYFGYGLELMNNDDCTQALEYFTKSGLDSNDENVKYCNMFNKYYSSFKTAEDYFKDGKLSKAKEAYEKIDNTFKYKEISVADRLSTLKEYEKFVNITGTKSGKGKMEVRHIYKRDGSWESWYADYTNSATVTAQIQEDGSVKINITAKFYSYSKYSTLSYALGEKEYSAYYSATVKKDGSIPSKFDSFPAAVAPSGTIGNASLTYSKNTFTLNFLLDDKNYSQAFRNKYTSKITYK